MKLTDVLLAGLSVALLIIAIDQTITIGFSEAYWAFMLAAVAFFIFVLRRGKAGRENDETPPEQPPKPAPKARKSRRKR